MIICCHTASRWVDPALGFAVSDLLKYLPQTDLTCYLGWLGASFISTAFEHS